VTNVLWSTEGAIIMSVENPSRRGSAAEQVPHSGVGGFERPVEQHDTPLTEDVQIPDTTETLRPTDAEEALGAAHANRLRVPTEEEERTANRRGVVKKVIAGTAVVGTFIIGGIVGVKALGGSNESPEPRTEPTVSAPLNPGEVNPTPEASASAPTAETDPRNWTAENVPLMVDSNQDGTFETVTGVEAFREAVEISVADHRDWRSAAEALIDRTNAVVNWGASREEFDMYYDVDYTSRDGQRIGSPALKVDFVYPAAQEALFGTPQRGETVSGSSTSEWFETQQTMSSQTMGRSNRSQRDGGEAYQFAYNLDSTKGDNQIVLHTFNEETNTATFTMYIRFDDNAEQATLQSDETSVEGNQTWNVAMQQQDGVWKVIGINTREYSN